MRPKAFDQRPTYLQLFVMKTTPIVSSSLDVLKVIELELPASRIASAISDALVAEIVTKGGVKIPDHRSRLQAATLALAYLAGRPIERQEVVTVSVDADSSAGIADRLMKSPALREQLRKTLDDADARAAATDVTPG